MGVKLSGNGPYVVKDQYKASLCDKFIGIGSTGSSTHSYCLDYGLKANCGQYVQGEKVFISINGKRYNRVGINVIKPEIQLAANAKVQFITDCVWHRTRPYNIGEQEVAVLLQNLGYKFTDCVTYGLWTKS